ncbi:sulfur carrier protein CysO [bacterium BMS3Abin01]|nr:sulfur carrier protein CysO [bacterium BMS3Abin01]HDY69558.1 MoaD/ThiS family protein [Actinomycetota bacterium]
MKVEVRIPAMLRRLTGDARVVTVPGATVGEVIENLEQEYGGIRAELITDDGSIHRYVNIYLNDEDIRFLKQLDTPISAGDTISILPAVAGGRP